MKKLFVILLSVSLMACQENTSSDKNTLLTSITWEQQPYRLFNGEMSNYHSPIRFLPDGTYHLGEPGEGLTGNWMWQDENTIQLTLSGISGDGYFAEFPFPIIQQLTVKKLSPTKFQYVSKGEGTLLNKEEEVYLIARN